VSKGLRFDALLVRALAETLAERLGGRRIRALRLSAEERTVTFAFRDDALVWDLHPDRGWLLLERRRIPGEGLGLPVAPRIVHITAPPDERLVVFDIDGDGDGDGDDDGPRGGAIRRIYIELIGTHRNAVAVDATGVVRAVLRPRPAAERVLAVAKPYTPLPPGGRQGADVPLGRDGWRAIFADVHPSDRRATLLDRVAYASPINAPFVLGADDADGAHDAEGAYDRYVELLETRGQAWVLQPRRAAQPYPHRLEDRSALREADLLDAFATAASLRLGTAEQDAFIAETSAALDALRARAARAELRSAKLRDEAKGAPEEAAALRRRADLLLAQLHRIPKGAAAAELDDFEGGTLRVELDPTLSPSANANAFYDQAKKRERAAERIPALLRAAEVELARALEAEARIAAGEATRDEVAAIAGGARKQERSRGKADAAPLPYRVYRTSGGLEVRVGRNNRANDDLTARHASPDDIWLHAESVPGAHVVLRWGKRDANPPAGDLQEAAILAAVHSRARTSGMVPVTWTRRKYVRKPRKAAAGAVVVERGKTLFVAPDAEVEKRLRLEND
jgi:predicted ribosome quality control (RQC) complex YloA/Tae2 family protein